MRSTNHNKISEERVNVFNQENTFELAKKLRDENYAISLNRSKDFHLRLTLSRHMTGLSSNYFRILY